MGWRQWSVRSRLAGCVCGLCFLTISSGVYFTYMYQETNSILGVNVTSFLPGSHHGRNMVPTATKNKTRVLCLIMTSPKSRDKMAAVNATWVRRCDGHLFVYGLGGSVAPGPGILVVNVTEDWNKLTPKVKSALIHVHKHYNDFDWVLKADDDTYIIMENLKRLLSQYDPSYPAYLGCRLKMHLKLGYMSGGAGYVISAAGLRNLVEQGLTKAGACKQEMGYEDVDIGRCIHETKVSVLSSLDPQGRETFHPEPIDKYLLPPVPDWLNKYMWNEVRSGPDCCSRYSISFHRVNTTDMYVYDHLLYNMAVDE